MDNLPPGQSIGPYRIISQIGQGGMATVYKAYHAAMDRYVALKVLPRQLAASREFTGRFEHEARLIAKLEHAHILPVHDYGEADGHTFLAMRFVEAGTLKDRLQAGPLSADEIDRYFTQLADALDYAHAMGIVHRDLKPSNVLLDTRGNLFLTDFGIAKLLEGSPEFTNTGALIGTPAYMSPEQAQGQRVDLRTDIYSLGIVLYEMVTGRVPFEADTPLAVILKHLNAPLPLPSALKPDVPPAVERVLLKALAKDREERFATTAEFIAAWQAARPALRAATATAAASTRATPSAPLAQALPTIAEPLPGNTPAVAAPPAANRTPLPAPVSTAPPRSRARLGLFGLAAAGALLLLGALVCGVVAVVLLNRPGLGGTAGAATATAGSVDGGGGGGGGVWQSWAAANVARAVAISDGQLVTGGPGSVVGWDMAAGTLDTQLTGANGLPSPDVYALLADPDAGLFWIGTADGLVSTDGQTLTVYRQADGLDSNTIFALALTSQGVLAGTAYGGPGGGLNVLTADGWQPVPDFPSVDAEDDPEHLSSTVTALLEDDNGELWVGTTNGLGRYDGSTWALYSMDSGLPHTTITALAVVDGEVWAGTLNGVARFNGETFEAAPRLEGWYVFNILPTTAGEVWVSLSGGLARRSTGSGADWQFYSPDDLLAYDIYAGVEAPDGTLYFGTQAGVLRVAGDERSLWRVPDAPTVVSFGAITAGPEPGQVWFIEEFGVRTNVFDLAADAWQPGPALACDYCVPLARDGDGRLWAGGDLGVWVLDTAGDIVAHLTSADGLPAEGVYSVALAPTGEAWLATPGGVAVYDGENITAVYDSATAGLATDAVHAVWAASDGALWAATEYGLSRLDVSGEWTHFGAGDPFESDLRVNDLAEDADGAIWLATAGEGVYRYADGVWTNYKPGDNGVSLPTPEIRSVTVAPDGSLWFGAYYNGAVRFDGDTWQVFQIEDGLIHSNVNDIFVDEAGSVWFATSGGVSRYQP